MNHYPGEEQTQGYHNKKVKRNANPEKSKNNITACFNLLKTENTTMLSDIHDKEREVALWIIHFPSSAVPVQVDTACF